MTQISRHNRLTKAELLEDETIFSIANGYLGTRGTFCEGYGTPYTYHQTYLNGLYDYYDYHYEENLTGFPQSGQKIINLYDGTSVQFQVEGILLNLANATIVKLERTYDLKHGFTHRKVTYALNGKEFTIAEKRIVSSQHRFVLSQDITLSTTDYTGVVTVLSNLSESRKSETSGNDPRLHQGQEHSFEVLNRNPSQARIHLKTNESNLHVCSAVVHNIPFEPSTIDNGLRWTRDMELRPDHPIHLIKHTIHTSDLYDEDYLDLAISLQRALAKQSMVELEELEATDTQAFWARSNVSIPNNPDMEQKLRYNMFQLYRQGGEHHVHNIAAKGLSGEGYEGHYFWDTEIYMMPFFTLTSPNKAKQLLLYRYHKMEEARQEARNLGYQQGIKIPWRTINGTETSPYYPAGSAQFHINSDVAYALVKYIEATNDIDFFIQYGFELMLETARFLKEAVNEYGGEFHLNSVTGPDEYTTVVDDNNYTNFMLRYHFRKLVEYYETYKEPLQGAITELGVTETEMHQFKDISERIALPYDEPLGIYTQDRAFLQKKILDLSKIPKENFPLLLHYHPLFLYKHQVLKQADTMLAMMLLDEFDLETIRRSFQYYEPITTHDSSLSKCIYSIIAFQLGLFDQAEKDLKLVLDTDLNNVHHNTKDGLHVANMGGSYMGFLFGLVGLRIHQDHLSLFPRVSQDIDSYAIRFTYHGQLVSITVDHMVKITSTGPIQLKLYDQWIDLDQSTEIEVPLH